MRERAAEAGADAPEVSGCGGAGSAADAGPGEVPGDAGTRSPGGCAARPDGAVCAAPAAETEPRRGRFPGVVDLLALLGVFFLALFCGGVASVAAGGVPDGEASPERQGFVLAVSSLTTYAVALFGMLAYRRARGGRGRIARFSARGFDPVLLLWGLVFLVALGVVLEPLLVLLPPAPVEGIGAGSWSMLALVVLAPLFEELICRGLVLESLRARYGVFVAWFGSSLFFGVMHIQPQLAVNAFFVGLVLAFLYLRTDSLWVAVLLHAFNNAIAYLLLRVSGGTVFVSELTGGGAVYYAAYAVSAVVCAVSARGVWRTLVRHTRAAKNGTGA